MQYDSVFEVRRNCDLGSMMQPDSGALGEAPTEGSAGLDAEHVQTLPCVALERPSFCKARNDATSQCFVKRNHLELKAAFNREDI
jgi:hypothetical protein